MRVLTANPPPAALEALLERRREIGADTHDEIWEGVLHMAPAPHDRHADIQAQIIFILVPLARAAGLVTRGEFNLGEADNFRVPDAAVRRPGESGLYIPTAALVVEIISPGDESWEKPPFYAAHQVDELLMVDPDTRNVDWLALSGRGEYERVQRSGLIELGAAELARQIDWPPLEPEASATAD